MNIHNTFEINHKEKTVSAENTVTNAGRHLQQNLAYAAYIVLQGTDGVIAKKTELIKICRDIDKGTLSASYRIELGENEYGGFAIERVGFSPYQDGAETANTAEFDGIVKETGHALVITGTVYISLSDTGAYFSGGENPLSDFFLGVAPLKDTGFYAAPYSQKYGITSSGTLMKRNVTASGLMLSVTGAETGEDGIVVLMDGKPVLGLPCIIEGVTKSFTKTAEASGRVKAGGGLAEVSDISLSGKPLTGARILRAVTGSSGYEESQIRLGSKGCLLTEPGGRFFAASGEKDVMLFSAENTELIRILKNRGHKAALTEDGAVAFLGDSLIIVDSDGAESEYPVSCDGQAAIVTAAGGGYYILCENEGFLMRFLINGGTVKLLGMTRASGKLCLFRFGREIAAIDGTEISVTNEFGRNAAAENALAGFLLNFALKAKVEGDEGLVVVRDGNGGAFAGDFVCGSLVSVPAGAAPSGGAVLIPWDGYTSVCVFDYGSGQLREILRADENATAAVIAGGRIITKNVDGVMKTAKTICGDTYIYHGDIANKSVSFKASEASVAGDTADVSVSLLFL